MPPHSPLISPDELDTLLHSPAEKIVLIDASYAIGATGLDPETVFNQMRIGQAQFFDIDRIADQTNPLPHMLPSPDDFAQAVGALGISNDHTVICYDQSGIVMAACRAWWMFRVFGHDKVYVLNGGLPGWQAAGLPLTTAPVSQPKPQTFVPKFRPELVIDYQSMRQAVEASSSIILDARPKERFMGLTPEPRPNLSAGHMPGAISVPAGSLIDPRSRELLPQPVTQQLFYDLNLKPDSPIITTCGSGVTACVIALALFQNGYENATVYDGSWTEWGQEILNSPIIKAN